MQEKQRLMLVSSLHKNAKENNKITIKGEEQSLLVFSIDIFGQTNLRLLTGDGL